MINMFARLCLLYVLRVNRITARAEHVCFSVQVMVMGYHACKDVWDTTIVKKHCNQSEHGNTLDAFTVAVLKDRAIVGHVPHKISAAYSMFLH